MTRSFRLIDYQLTNINWKGAMLTLETQTKFLRFTLICLVLVICLSLNQSLCLLRIQCSDGQAWVIFGPIAESGVILNRIIGIEKSRKLFPKNSGQIKWKNKLSYCKHSFEIVGKEIHRKILLIRRKNKTKWIRKH